MKLLLESLLKILEEIVICHSKLNELLIREKSIMRRGSIENLEWCTKEKETINLKLKILEESREKIVEKIAMGLNVKKSDLTLTHLGQLSGGVYSKHFFKTGNRLKVLIASISKLNAENRAFIECFMNHLKMSLSFLNQVRSQEPTYLENGDVGQNSDVGRSLCKI